jgi:hypothetical protein
VIDNEERADYGLMAVMPVAMETGVAEQEFADTAITDVLAYIAHLCDRLGLNPDEMFSSALHSYQGDEEDGPFAEKVANGTNASLVNLFGRDAA